MKKLFTSFIALTVAVLAFGADTVPWSEDFSKSGCISGWPNYKINTYSYGFVAISSGLQVNGARTNRVNDARLWFTKDGFMLEAGKSYRFDTDYRALEPNGERYFEILLYKKGDAAPTVNDECTQLNRVDNVSNVSQTSSTYFEVPETGEYYLCLHMYSDPTSRAMYWDNFKLVEASMDGPAKPSITVKADPSGVLKGEVTVTAPATTIRGGDVGAMSRMDVFRDGGLVQSFANPAAGQVFTFTDKVAQPGSHTYSAIAYNDKGAGAEFSMLAMIGTSVQEREYLYDAIYSPDGKVTVYWPEKTDVTSYKIVCSDGRTLTGTPVLDEETKKYSLQDTGLEIGTEPNGWQYHVFSVAEDGTETSLGYTNYLCLNNEVPYYPAFNFKACLDPFTLEQPEKYGWQYSSGSFESIMAGVKTDYSTLELIIHNLISPGIKLSKDKFYRVKLTNGSDYGYTKYTIKAGKSNRMSAMDITVTEDHPTVKTDSYLTKSSTDQMFFSVPEDGMYFISLFGKVPNDKYTNDTFRVKRFDIIEADPLLPNASTDVSVSYSPTGGNDGKVHFKAPAKSISGSDLTSLTKVEVYKDGELFVTLTDGVAPGAELSFDVTVTAGESNLYTMLAYNEAGQGEPAVAKVFVLSPPYINTFDKEENLEGFTTINNTASKQDFHIQNSQVRIYPDEAGNDHWLITPPITLAQGMYYMLNFRDYALKSDNGGTLDVFIGKAPTQEAMTDRVMETSVIDGGTDIYQGNKEEYFTVAENGQYFLGFHFRTPAGRGVPEIYFDNLSISAGISGTAPDRGLLEVKPAADGSLKAELIYTCPSKSLNGSDLNANSTQDVYFYINGVQTPSGRTFKAYPNQKVAIEVEVPEDLPYIFSARAGWNGRVSYNDAFVGINIPSYPDPDKVVLEETRPYGHVKMTWEAPVVDYEGYPLNPDLLTYDVSELKVDLYGNPYETAVGTGVTGTTLEFDAIDADADQTMKRYVLRARNTKGQGSKGVLTPYVNVGRPYRMPYVESFSKNGEAGVNTAIFDEILEGMAHWGLMTDGLEAGVKSADGDGVYLAMESPYIGGRGIFYTGKVNLGSGDNPSLSLMVYNHSKSGMEDANTLEFKVYSYSDDKWHSLGEPKSVNELCNGITGWNKVTMDLSAFTDNVVIAGIEATCHNFVFTSIDNIRIREKISNDLSYAGHDTPVSVIPGETFTVNVKVTNNGLAATTPEAVEMYVDGEKAAEATVAEIPVGEQVSFLMTHSFPSVDLASSHELSYKIVYADDEDDSDNASPVYTVATVESGLNPVENLTGVSDNQIVSLNWDAPSPMTGGVVTESFEDWNADVASQKGWTAYDADGRPIKGINDGTGNALVIPGLEAFAPASWAVVDNVEGALGASVFPACTGQKFLLSITPVSESGSTDDWMISPELSGKAQTVTFHARNYPGYRAGYEVLYSDGSMIPSSFISLDRDAVNSNEWTEISVELPEGAKRLALRNISYCEDGFLLMIDDVTYEGASAESKAVKGYNVYRESECVASPQNNAYQFEGEFEPGTYTFGVTARYANGESALVPVEVDVTSGVATTEVSGIHVFGGRGCIHITGAEGLAVAVYDLSGVTLASGTVGAEGRIAAAPGVYVVSVDGKSYKVMVK